jgi:hypothetical protein
MQTVRAVPMHTVRAVPMHTVRAMPMHTVRAVPMHTVRAMPMHTMPGSSVLRWRSPCTHPMHTACTKSDKICSSCCYFRNYGMFTSVGGKCAHPSSCTSNLVDGHVQFGYASVQREYGECGPSGACYTKEDNSVSCFVNNIIGTFYFIMSTVFVCVCIVCLG